ncbi:hexosaminidase D isoform X2 [Andrena cerasifolii]|uniref:hexosaminidase D isoform X2 n=1 Tax=Andrena cerasifolii TaxID=2819439 RepID=UPI0040384688
MDGLTFGLHRLIHLDLKGAPLRVCYFEKLFPLLRTWGATGLLLEWEDTFPYNRELSHIGSNGPSHLTSGYTAQEAKHILQIAGDCGLAIVPLVQTFGHMEFVLKHNEWRSLREVEHFPSSICPSNPRTLPLVKSLIRQIVNFHPDIQYLHIGADEVWHLGLCLVCTKRAASSKYGKAALYLEHISAVAQFVQETYPYLKIIIWDDMLRSIDMQILNDHYIGKYVEPMIWHYNPRDNFALPHGLWDKYAAIFPRVWAATAFKGATGSSQHVPVIRHHISNHEKWIEELGVHVTKIHEFRGTAFTGWSRISTWMNPWQVANNYTNPMQLENLIPAFTELVLELSSLEGYLRFQMESIFFTTTIDEWIGTNIQPMKGRLVELKQTAENQVKLNSRV